MRKRLVQPRGRHGCVLVGGQHPAFDDAHAAHPLPAGVGVGIHIVVVDVCGDIREQFVADLVHRAVENDDVHRHVVFSQKFADGVHRHAERLILWIAKNAGGDQRKCHRLTAVLLRQRKARPVAGNQQLPLTVTAPVPHRADGVDHILTGQPVSLGDLGIAGLAATERPALGQQLRSRRAMDTAIHAATTQQRFVRRIDDGIHFHFCNIIANNFKRHGSIPQFLSFKIKSMRRCLPPFPLQTVLPNPHDFRTCEGNRGRRPRRRSHNCKT